MKAYPRNLSYGLGLSEDFSKNGYVYSQVIAQEHVLIKMHVLGTLLPCSVVWDRECAFKGICYVV